MPLRTSGVLVHPTSLPGPFGCGDLGPEAYRFVDFLVTARQRLWQVLPLGPTGYGDSPYAAISAFAGNPLLISIERLAEEGLLSEEEAARPRTLSDGAADFERAWQTKEPLLRRAHAALAGASGDIRRDLDRFVEHHHDWLFYYALFAAVRDQRRRVSWHDWEPPLAQRERQAIARASVGLAGEIAFHSFLQFIFFKQWQELHDYARARAVQIVGDMPIYVADDSVDVWAHREVFRLDGSGQPLAIAGVPPDYFSATGQRWGNPLYDWDALAATGFGWWIARVRHTLGLVDLLRLDHFRGFEAYWEVPASEPTAVNGRWVRGPGVPFFSALEKALGSLPFIAEDLGLITPEVDTLRTAFHLPGMAILQFAFDGGPTNAFLPHNLGRDCVAYTGTHDNDTTAGWFATKSAVARRRICRYLGTGGQEIAWDLIRAALNTVADTAIVPLQDVLSLGNEARMNTPGQLAGNWRWRYAEGQLTGDLAERLAELTELSGRGLHRGPPSRVTYTAPGDLE